MSTQPEMLRVRALSQEVGRYAAVDPQPPKLDHATKRLLELLEDEARRMGVALPPIDARLCRAAQVMARGSRGLLLPPMRLVSFALSSEGIVQSDAWLLVGRFDSRAPDSAELRDSLRRALQGIQQQSLGIGSRVELGVYDVFVIATQSARAEVEPFPRSLAPGSAVTIRLRPIAPNNHPAAYVTGVDGKVRKPSLRQAADGAVELNVECGRKPGVLQVEVMVTALHGPAVALNVPIGCGQDPPSTIVLPRPGAERFPASVADAEQRLLELVNRDRAQAGLEPLLPDESAAVVARAHSEDMARHGFFGHVSPTTGSTDDRLRAAGLTAPWAAENVAASVSPAEAHEGLMASPGHRGAILSSQATHVGIGAAFGPSSLGGQAVYATEVFLGDTAHGEVTSAVTTRKRPVRWVEKEAKVASCRIRGLRSIQVSPGWRQHAKARARVNAEIGESAGQMGADTVLVEELKAKLDVTFFSCDALPGAPSR